MTTQVEIKSETAAKLQAIAASLQLSLDGYLEKVTEHVSLPQPLEVNGHAPGLSPSHLKTPQPTPYELEETLLAQFELRSGQQVSQYLGQYPFLLPLILEAEARLKSLFNPATKTVLEVTADPSDGSTQLYLVIPTKLPAVTAYELFERLEREWWLEASEHARFRLNIVPEFI